VKDKWRCLFASSDKNQWDSALTEGSGELVNVKSTETQANRKRRAMKGILKIPGKFPGGGERWSTFQNILGVSDMYENVPVLLTSQPIPGMRQSA
jgi:hypothetical protein